MFEGIHNNLKKSIVKSQHVQRNWDLSKEMPAEDIDLLVHAATNCPSKQNFRFYKLHFITNRETIEKAHGLTVGVTTTDGEKTTNSQTLANLLIVFEDVERSRDYKIKWLKNDNSHPRIWSRDQDMAIGVAAGYLNVVASMLGYGTGCCACFDGNHVSEQLGYEKEVLLMMGIGYGDENKNRRLHHVTNKLVNKMSKEPIEVVFDR